MQNLFINQLDTQKTISELNSFTRDKDAPFSYLEWKDLKLRYEESSSYTAYQEYLLDWFASHKNLTITSSFVLKQKYFYLIQQLQTFFTESEKQEWYNKINLANEKELLLAIPFFAKKLKNISLYYLKLRNKLKSTKLKYNKVGTQAGLEQELKKLLLEKFSSLNTEITPELKKTLPSFETLKNNLEIKVEELYDDFSYFDKSTTIATSAYFDLFNQTTASLFQAKGLTLSADDWIFKSLDTVSLSSYELFVNNLTANVFEVTDTTLYKNLLEKYIGENKISTSFLSLSSSTEIVSVPIFEGNNYFFYPYGTYDESLAKRAQLVSVPLSSLNLNGSTAGQALKDSDVVFVKTGNLIKGAWLKNIDFETTTKHLYAKIKEEGTTSFIFPYPGFGLSAENVEWTGYSLSATEEYQFLSKELKSAVNERYWTGELPQDRCESLYINKTTLIDQGSYPNENPNNADKIYLFNERPIAENLPFERTSGAWLFQFDRTSTPITSNHSLTSTYVWPLQYVDPKYDFPDQLANFDFYQFCKPVDLQRLADYFAIPGTNFETADKIYKVASYNDSFSNATECAWLSGASYITRQNNGSFSWVQSKGFSAYFAPGSPTTFVWTGPQNTPVSRLFSAINHSIDCELSKNTTLDTISACSCKQVYYSPHGHPGNSFYDYGSNADYVVEDNYTDNAQPFDLNSALNLTTKFAWFKTNTHPTWGNGKWVYGIEGTSAPFLLQTGKVYTYVRSTSRKNKPFSPYIVNYRYATNQQNPPIWIQAKKTLDGDWASADTISNFKLNPGDFIKWDRQTDTTFYKISSKKVEVTPNRINSIWATNDIVPLSTVNSTVQIFWPFDILDKGEPRDSQIPVLSNVPVPAADVEYIDRWVIQHESIPAARLELFNTPFVSFTPQITGVYNISVDAVIRIDDTTTVPATFTNISTITAVPKYRDDIVYVPLKYKSSGYLIEQPLEGWNYGTLETPVEGAKPYWAELDTGKSESTRFKGLFSWGYPNLFIDSYLPDYTPRVSPLLLNYGNIINYERKGLPLIWRNPLEYKTFVGKTQWCKLSSTTNSASILSSFYDVKQKIEPTVYFSSEPSEILLTNFANGYPVEVFYYALNSFVWNISATTTQLSSNFETSVFLQSKEPVSVISNRFYPTIATVPVAEQLYSEYTNGGYFLPNYLGASQYVNENFTPFFAKNYFNETVIGEDVTEHIGGRGLTKQTQETLYKWNTNDQWLKEPPTSNALVGSVKKSITKRYQTFVPYKNTNEQNQLGLIHPLSRLNPWGGNQGTDWVDSQNQPISYTGVRNLSAWTQDQILKQTSKEMDCWTTDIFGNQYGLYKPELSSISTLTDKRKAMGELWVRTNKQRVFAATTILSSVYELFGPIPNSNVYHELFQNHITNVDCFYDTLYIETTSSAIFLKLDYNFEQDEIISSFDKIFIISLSSNELIGQTWFNNEEKKVLVPVIGTSQNSCYVNLWEYDLTIPNKYLVFPSVVNQAEYETLIPTFSTLDIKSINTFSTSWNPIKEKYLLTFTGTTNTDKPFVSDLIFKYKSQYNLTEIATFSAISLPEIPVALNPTLFASTSTSQITIQLSSTNNPTYYQLLNYSDIATIDNTGTLILNAPYGGVYHINYEVGNEFGSNAFCASIAVNLPTPTPTPSRTPAPTRPPTPTPSVTISQTPTLTPTPEATPGPTPILTPFPTATPPMPTLTPTEPIPTMTPTPSRTPGPTAIILPTATAPIPTPQATPFPTPQATKIPATPQATSVPAPTPIPTSDTVSPIAGWNSVFKTDTFTGDNYINVGETHEVASLNQNDIYYVEQMPQPGGVTIFGLLSSNTQDVFGSISLLVESESVKIPFGFRRAVAGDYRLGPEIIFTLSNKSVVQIDWKTKTVTMTTFAVFGE